MMQTYLEIIWSQGQNKINKIDEEFEKAQRTLGDYSAQIKTSESNFNLVKNKCKQLE